MAAGEQRGDEKMDVNPAQPRPQSLRSSSKARASASDANSAEGSAWRSERITVRSFKLPHASSPEIHGCIRTAPSESRSANLGSPCRKCATHTEVSAKTITQAGDAE